MNDITADNYIDRGLLMKTMSEAKKYNNDYPKYILRVSRLIHEGTGYDPFENTTCRRREIVESRQLLFYFLSLYTTKTLNKIGATLGKDHATVIHAVRTINNRIETEKDLRELVKLLNDKIKKL